MITLRHITFLSRRQLDNLLEIVQDSQDVVAEQGEDDANLNTAEIVLKAEIAKRPHIKYSIRYSIQREPDGSIAVHQGLVHGWEVSFNPDDDKFYIHSPLPDNPTVAKRKDWDNVVLWCKDHQDFSHQPKRNLN
jgi:hypothetical protein